MKKPPAPPLVAVLKSLAVRALIAWRRGLVLLLLGIGVSYGVSRLVLKPIYRSETTLLYREAIRASDDDDRDSSPKSLGAKLREMLLARSKLERIMQEFALYPELRAKDPVAAVDKFRTEIKFVVNQNTYSISFDGPSPEVARAVTSRLADALIEESARLKRERAEATKGFLDAEKRKNDEELNILEQRLAKFLAAHPEYAVDPNSGQRTMPAARTSAAAPSTDGPQTALDRQIARLRERLASLGGPGKSEEVRSAEDELANAERELKDAMGRFTESHPDVVAAKAKVSQARAARDRARARAAGAAAPSVAQRRAMEAQLRELETLAAASKGGKKGKKLQLTPELVQAQEAAEESDVVRVETEFATIHRDVEEARERSKQLEAKLFKAEIALNVETGTGAAQLMVVDPAYLPVTPARFSKTRVVAGGAGVALVLALGLMLITGKLDDRLYLETDVSMLHLGPLTIWVPGGRAAPADGPSPGAPVQQSHRRS